MSELKIPDTDSIEELAHFWDTHDLTDFDDQLEEVTEPVFERDTETVTIMLPQQEFKTVKKIAESRGTSYTDLIRGWVREKIQAT